MSKLLQSASAKERNEDIYPNSHYTGLGFESSRSERSRMSCSKQSDDSKSSQCSTAERYRKPVISKSIKVVENIKSSDIERADQSQPPSSTVRSDSTLSSHEDSIKDLSKPWRTILECHLKQIKQQHLSWFSRGRYMTMFAIFAALLGLSLSIASRQSLAFVSFTNPLFFSTYVKNITELGLLNTQICFEESPSLEGSTPVGVQAGVDVLEEDNIYRRILQEGAGFEFDGEPLTGCHIIHLGTEDVNDSMWNVSRSFMFLAIALGLFSTIMLSTSIIWKTINLKPISVGLLLSYFFQSLSFFFFDSDLCRAHVCGFAQGSQFSMVSCAMWFISGIVSIRMDAIYQNKLRRAARQERRAERKSYKHTFKAMQRSESSATSSTINSSDNSTMVIPQPSNPASFESSEHHNMVNNLYDDEHNIVEI